MLKIHRASFSRIDLSTVLEKIIHSIAIHEKDYGFDKEFSKKFGYKECYGFASLGQAMQVILSSFCKKDTTAPRQIRISMPILSPYALVHQLQTAGFALSFYDLGMVDGALALSMADASTGLATGLYSYDTDDSQHRASGQAADALHITIAPSFFGELPIVYPFDPALDSFTIRLLYSPQAQLDFGSSPSLLKSLDIYSLSHNNYISALGGALVAANHSPFVGSKSPLRSRLFDELSPLNAALAQAQLLQYDDFAERTKALFAVYREKSNAIGLQVVAGASDVFDGSLLQCFPVFSAHAKEIYKLVHSQAIEAEYLFKESYLAYSLEHTERSGSAFFDRYNGSIQLLQSCIGIPLNPSLSEQEEKKILKTLSSFPS